MYYFSGDGSTADEWIKVNGNGVKQYKINQCDTNNTLFIRHESQIISTDLKSVVDRQVRTSVCDSPSTYKTSGTLKHTVP